MRAHPRFFNRHQKSTIFLLILIPLLSFSAPQFFPRTVRASNSTYSVAIVDYAFQPAHINITTGTTVTWTYSSGGAYHTVTSQPQTNLTQSGTPLVNSGNLNPGQSFSFTFYNPGYYPYVCEVHPNIMKGWVMVTGTPITPPGSSSNSGFPTSLVAGAVIVAIAVVLLALLFLRRKFMGKQPSSSSSTQE